MSGVRSSEVTLLFTDIEGSTRMWEDHPAAMDSALRSHDAILRQSIEGTGGSVFKTVGDAFCAAFPTADLALEAAARAQRALAAEAWPTPLTIRVRMALHTGSCVERDRDFFGPTVNRVARIEAVAHGGQTLLSDAAASSLDALLPRDLRLRDLGQHRLKDLVAPAHLYQLEIEGISAEFPPLRSLGNATLRNNLPRYATSFIGRASEVEELTALVHGGRLVTLVGPGGTGKTRLAVQVAAELLDGSGDGAWLVELAAASDETALLAAFARALGIRYELESLDPASLVDALSTRRMLIVLDNCEHIVDAVAMLAELILRTSPEVALLATSREPLRVSGEQVYRLGALSPPGEAADTTDLLDSDAIHLFADRARLHQADFTVDETNAEDVSSICRRLDCIPLAIELAAARLGALSVAEVEARLSDRFRLLTTGGRASAARHQTLRASIDWSYDLLDTTEQELFDRLAVFVDGATSDAVTAVCAGDRVDAMDTIDLLASLVDKSLLQLVPLDDGSSRYRMLETLHEYANARLAERGTRVVSLTRDEHARYFLAQAEQFASDFAVNDDPARYHQLARDDDNLRAAIEWAVSCGTQDMGVRFVAALRRYWSRRKLVLPVLPLAEAALKSPGPASPTLANALECLAFLYDDIARFPEAAAMYARAAGVADEVGDMRAVALALTGRALVACRQGNLPEARELAERALAAAQLGSDAFAISECEATLGAAATLAGDLQASRVHYARALTLAQETNLSRHIGGMFVNLAYVALQMDDAQGAREYLGPAEHHLVASGDENAIGYWALNDALASTLTGDATAAFEGFTRALRIAHGSMDPVLFVGATIGIARDWSVSAPEHAAALCGFVDATATRIGYELEPVERRLRDETEVDVRSSRGNDTFQLARENGERLSDADVIALCSSRTTTC